MASTSFDMQWCIDALDDNTPSSFNISYLLDDGVVDSDTC